MTATSGSQPPPANVAGGRVRWQARHSWMPETDTTSEAVPSAYQRCAPTQRRHPRDFVQMCASSTSPVLNFGLEDGMILAARCRARMTSSSTFPACV
jgi:hypothetical protein